MQEEIAQEELQIVDIEPAKFLHSLQCFLVALFSPEVRIDPNPRLASDVRYMLG
jgi:hypothetical protein